MYAIASYWDEKNTRVPFIGTTCQVVISDLKTVRGIVRRAIRHANRYGRGHLFGIEVWTEPDRKYSAPSYMYRSEKNGDRIVRVYVPLLELAREATATMAS